MPDALVARRWARLAALTRACFETVVEPREEIIHRAPPERGFWAQWEAVYRRR